MKNNPKNNTRQSLIGQNSWYYYYAGFSDFFVDECITKYITNNEIGSEIILDPWNGTGTTTTCASVRGIKSIGVDINPVMYVVAKAKMFAIDMITQNSWENTTDKEGKAEAHIKQSDPLCKWFSRKTVRCIRSLEQNMLNKQVYSQRVQYAKDRFEFLDAKDSYIYLCFFLLLRKYCEKLYGSNPTWIKANADPLICVDYNTMRNDLLKILSSHRLGLHSIIQSPASIRVSLSQHIDIPDKSVGLVITSPPYCTRIDYAIYTQVENAMLGYDRKDIENLRHKMIGSPTIHHSMENVDFLNKLEYCKTILADIKTHNSKAASSYYFKTYRQYFSEMLTSIVEIKRVLKTNGKAVIVIQDSWFKNLHVDVAMAIIEISRALGFQCSREDFLVKSNMVNINAKSRSYKKEKKATESVIMLRKEDELC